MVIRLRFVVLLMLILLPCGWTARATTALDSQLIEAAKQGDLTLVKNLLDEGATVNATLKDGSTALMWATISGNTELAKLLLDKGADVNAKADDEFSAFMWAAIMEHQDIVNLLKSRGAEMTLPIAAMLGDKAELQRLIEAGADVNAQDRRGRTALMNAAQRGHIEVMKLLLEKGG